VTDLVGPAVRVTASSDGLTAEHRVVWARLGRLEAICAQRSARGVVLGTSPTTI
jgi:hypothetical protein